MERNAVKLPLHGGCLCGKIRYQVNAAPQDAGYCHCRLCQLSSGAPVVAWATVAQAHFSYTAGTPACYASSSKGRREFCPDCGTLLTFSAQDYPDWLDFTVASLDQPQACPPTYHIWTNSRITWFDTDDHLPRHPDAGEDWQP